jgi:hypothetical protein
MEILLCGPRRRGSVRDDGVAGGEDAIEIIFRPRGFHGHATVIHKKILLLDN